MTTVTAQRNRSAVQFAIVRRLCLITVVLGALLAHADIIRLKNGRSIVVDSAREANGKIEYSIGEDTFAIPKSLVERIDTGGSPVVSRGRDIPVPADEPRKAVEVENKVVRDDRVDVSALEDFDHASPETAAAAYFAAGLHEKEHGSLDKAERYFQRALSFTPDDPAVLEHMAALMLQMNRFGDAANYAGRATRSAPQSADAWGLLGIAQYYSDDSDRAVHSLQKSLDLSPNATIDEFLRKAKADESSEANFGQQQTAHFLVRYEGGSKIPPALREQIVGVLEAHFTELESQLDYSPRDTIPVFLYTEQSFFDITQAPTWAGAINDGKLRIPISGVTEVNGELSRVLKHELAHSFIDQMTRNRCPVWLNEGVAQLVEPKNSSRNGAALATVFTNGQEVPLGMLEAPFSGLTTDQARLAYAESLAATETIAQTYGMSDVVSILTRIGEGATPEAAMRATIHSGYKDLEEETGRYLKRNYGN